MTKRESKYIRKGKKTNLNGCFDVGNKVIPFPQDFKIKSWHGYIDKKSKP